MSKKSSYNDFASHVYRGEIRKKVSPAKATGVAIATVTVSFWGRGTTERVKVDCPVCKGSGKLDAVITIEWKPAK